MFAQRLCAISSLAVLLVAGPLSADILYLGDTYADKSDVLRFDTEGTATNPTYVVHDQPGYIRDIHVDTDNGRMYWACDPAAGNSYVRSSNLSGGEQATMYEPLNVYGMTADPAGGYVYYGGSPEYTGTAGLVRRELDGSNAQLIAASGSAVYDVVANPAGGKLYWSQDYTAGRIRQANLDGSNPVDVVTGYTYITDLDVDEARGLIYWISQDTIYRAPIDGSGGPETILTGMEPLCLGLSPDGNRLYFGNGDNSHDVYRMDADGSNVTYVTYVYKPVAIAVVPEPGSASVLTLAGLAFLRRRRNR